MNIVQNPKILTLNKIAKIGLNRFSDNYVIGEEIAEPDGIMVRSASLHEMELPASLLAVARAGAGVNNIPIDKCSEQGIVVFNTPGANANAVKELVIAALFMSSRRIVPAIDWAKTLKGNGAEVGKMVEKGKSAFAGPEIKGKTLGVIGLGAIGRMVANAAYALDMDIIGYDPFLSAEKAAEVTPKTKYTASLDDIFANSDYITIHVPFNAETKGTVNAETIAKMKDGVRILNFARGELVDSDAIVEAVNSGKVACYITDFPTDAQLCVDGIIAIPHLGASTPESEDNCAVMAADELRNYIELGSIVNSVNYPALELDSFTGNRACIMHRNVPNVFSQLSGVFSAAGLNIEHMLSKSKGDYAYTVMDFANGDVDGIKAQLEAVSDVIRVRIL